MHLLAAKPLRVCTFPLLPLLPIVHLLRHLPVPLNLTVHSQRNCLHLPLLLWMLPSNWSLEQQKEQGGYGDHQAGAQAIGAKGKLGAS